MIDRLRVAACAYPIEPVASLEELAVKLADWVGEAARGGAQLVVLPEYAGMELTAGLAAEIQGDLPAQLAALQELAKSYQTVCDLVAQNQQVHLLAGSFPERVRSGDTHNIARLFSLRGIDQPIMKMQMTPWEKTWGIAPGRKLRLIDCALGKIGVAICYDAEFPLLVRRLAAAGARVILVPSCTDTVAGYWRVRVACQARALENQCYVVQAHTVGLAPWSQALDENHGAAAIYGPPDLGFADDGVVASGKLDRPGWVFADLDLAAVDRVRAEGAVRNHADWDLPAHLDPAVDVVKLL